MKQNHIKDEAIKSLKNVEVIVNIRNYSYPQYQLIYDCRTSTCFTRRGHTKQQPLLITTLMHTNLGVMQERNIPEFLTYNSFASLHEI